MFTGLFFWLLTNGPEFANDIITFVLDSWRERHLVRAILSIQARIIRLGMQVFQNTVQHMNFLEPENYSRTRHYCAHHSDRVRVSRSKHDPVAVRGLGGALCGYYLLGLWWLSMDIRHGD